MNCEKRGRGAKNAEKVGSKTTELCHKHKVSHRKVSVSALQDGARGGKEEGVLQETQKEIDVSSCLSRFAE